MPWFGGPARFRLLSGDVPERLVNDGYPQDQHQQVEPKPTDIRLAPGLLHQVKGGFNGFCRTQTLHYQQRYPRIRKKRDGRA